MNPKVYVVDDEPKVRESIADLLGTIDIHTELFESTEDFLAAFRFNPTAQECVIADLRMPGLSGLDLKRELNNHECSLPVILLTGYRDDETDVRAESLGIFLILEKPYPPAELIEVTLQALESAKTSLE